MTKKLILSLSLLAFLACSENKTKQDTKSSESNTVRTTSTRFILGDYFGILPAASGPGIMTDVVFKANGKYKLSMTYLEERGEYQEEGSYTVDKGLITLAHKDGNNKYFKAQGEEILMLDSDGQIPQGDIARHYILRLR